jgi:anti-anti-sigma regulatory factor
MLKIQRSSKGQEVVFVLSGRMDAENIDELETLLRKEASDRRSVLDLKDLTLVDQDGISFLRGCEADGMQLRNCPAYIRAWINGERR